ncbi:MAG: DUF2177 family protein [Pseudomonadota bacterium]
MTHLVAYAVTAFTLLAVDAVWLGFVAHDFYAAQLGDLMREQTNVAVAAAFYVIYAAGVTGLAVAPALAAGQSRAALWRGLLLGFCAYGTYDLTNLATLRNWPVAMSVVDLLWGTVLTGTAAVAGYAMTRRLLGM